MKPGLEPRRQTIPVLLQVKTALQILWQQRDDALRLGLIPALLMFGGVLYGRDALDTMRALAQTGIPVQIPPGVAGPIMVMCVTTLLSACLIMVNWLRFLLLGPMGAVGLGLAERAEQGGCFRVHAADYRVFSGACITSCSSACAISAPSAATTS